MKGKKIPSESIYLAPVPLVLNFTMADSIVTLDVGGKIFRTYIQTLTKYPESLLAVMFSHTDKGMAPMPKTKDGYYFLDVNPVYFELILSLLRMLTWLSAVLGLVW